MPESALQEIDKRFEFEVARRASIAYGNQFLIAPVAGTIAYGNQFLIAIPPSEEFYLGSSNIEGILQLRCGILRSSAKIEGIEDPLTQSALIESEEKEVQKLIYQVKTSSIRYREKLADRLITLFKDSKEEDPYGPGISAGSLRSFINLLQLHANLKQPSISLTPECNIYASWRDEQDRVFSVHFLPNGNARFVIFKPNDKHPERKDRFSGITTIDILMETVSSHKISDWVLE